MEHSFTAVIPAAGSSRRMGGENKLLFDLEGKPVIIRTLEAFDRSARIEKIILVTAQENFDVFRNHIVNFRINKEVEMVRGGERRQDSVINGLERVKTDYAAIHDGARPLLTQNLLNRLLDAAMGEDGCIPVLPVKDTIKVINTDGYVLSTPAREVLFAVQTPQVFKTEILRKSYEKLTNMFPLLTDDSMAVELYPGRVKTIPGSPENIKITTPEDIEIARMFIRKI